MLINPLIDDFIGNQKQNTQETPYFLWETEDDRLLPIFIDKAALPRKRDYLKETFLKGDYNGRYHWDPHHTINCLTNHIFDWKRAESVRIMNARRLHYCWKNWNQCRELSFLSMEFHNIETAWNRVKRFDRSWREL